MKYIQYHKDQLTANSALKDKKDILLYLQPCPCLNNISA